MPTSKRLSLFYCCLFLFLGAQAQGALSRRQFLAGTCGGAFLAPSPFATVAWEIVGPTDATPAQRGVMRLDEKISAGALTLKILRAAKVPFYGTESRLDSMMDTPTGRGAITLADRGMRVYGWCYEVDGRRSPVMPDRLVLPVASTTLRWFYGYSVYEDGAWVSHCNPAF